MSPKYFNLILFYLFTTSCISIVFGLNVEAVSSNDESKEDKTGKSKGKKPIENTQDPAEILTKLDKTGVEKKRQNSSSSSSASVKTVRASSHTTAELALITVLENVCKDLKIGDLLNAGSVCRSWNEIAERENSHRGFVEQALLPSIFSSEISYANSEFHVRNVLRILPSVAILFFSPTASSRPPNWENLEERTIAVYRRFFPQHLVVVSVEVSMMDENFIHSTPDLSHPYNGILGLFIPHHKDIQMKVSSCSLAGYKAANCIAQIIDDLTDSHKETSTIIILGNTSGYFEITYLLKLFKISFTHKSYSLWGAIDMNKIIHSKSINDISGEKSVIWALNLSGSNLKSWSIFIDCAIEDHEIMEKLLKFKNSLKLKQHTIGLVCGPARNPRDDTFSKKHPMELVKKIFPNIAFTAIFNTFFPSFQIGLNSVSDDGDQGLIHNNSLSLMIITHN